MTKGAHALLSLTRSFFLGAIAFLLSACNPPNSKHAGSVSYSNNDSTHVSVKSKNDSIEIVEEKHVVIDGHKIYQSISVDYRQVSDEKRRLVSNRDSIFLLRRVHSNPDTDKIKHITNPFPELNDVYYSFHKFRGRFVLAEQGEIIADPYDIFALTPKGFLYATMTEDELFAYNKAERTDNGVIYTCSTGNRVAVIRIESPDNKNHIQRWTIKTKYSDQDDTTTEVRLLMPMKYALRLPIVNSGNDFGVEYDMDIPFDTLLYPVIKN